MKGKNGTERWRLARSFFLIFAIFPLLVFLPSPLQAEPYIAIREGYKGLQHYTAATPPQSFLGLPARLRFLSRR